MNENIEVATKKESKYILTLLMCWFFGSFGVHRFINGKIGTGLLMIFTLGGLGIWKLIDVILLISNNFTNKEGEIIGYEGKFLSNPGNIAILILFILEIVLMVFLLFIFIIFMAVLFSSVGMYY